jgi:hypothetical protein
MQEKIYYYSKRKLLIRLAIACVILLVCFKPVYRLISTGEILSIRFLIICGIVGLGAALYLLVSIPVLFSKPRKEIEINEKGLHTCKNSKSEINFIPWDNISHLSQNKIESKNYICIHVIDNSSFSDKVKTKERRAILESNNIALLIDNENINGELSSIFNELELFFKKYGPHYSGDENKNDSKSKNTTLSYNDLKIPVMNVQVFMHYDSEVKQPKDYGNSNWVHQHVFFWSSTEKFENKSLPSEFKKYKTKYFIITKPIPEQLLLSIMKLAPGNDDKYFFNRNNKYFPFEQLFKSGNLKYIKMLDKKHHIFYNLNNIYASLVNINKGSFSEKEIILSQAISDDSVNLFQIDK